MKEVEVAYTDLELMQMGNDERAHVVSQRKMIGAGIGGLVLLAAAYSFFIAAKFFFLDVPLIEPLYFITSPFWCIPLLFLTRSVFFRTLLAIWVTVSLPFLFTFTFTIQDFYFGTSINFDYLFSNLSQFYELAYGDIGSKLQHLTISRALSLEQHKIFMSGIMLINSLVLVICFSMFYRICYDVILGFSKNKPTLEVNGFFSVLRWFVHCICNLLHPCSSAYTYKGSSFRLRYIYCLECNVLPIFRYSISLNKFQKKN